MLYSIKLLYVERNHYMLCQYKVAHQIFVLDEFVCLMRLNVTHNLNASSFYRAMVSRQFKHYMVNAIDSVLSVGF